MVISSQPYVRLRDKQFNLSNVPKKEKGNRTSSKPIHPLHPFYEVFCCEFSGTSHTSEFWSSIPICFFFQERYTSCSYVPVTSSIWHPSQKSCIQGPPTIHCPFKILRCGRNHLPSGFFFCCQISEKNTTKVGTIPISIYIQ